MDREIEQLINKLQFLRVEYTQLYNNSHNFNTLEVPLESRKYYEKVVKLFDFLKQGIESKENKKSFKILILPFIDKGLNDLKKIITNSDLIKIVDEKNYFEDLNEKVSNTLEELINTLADSSLLMKNEHIENLFVIFDEKTNIKIEKIEKENIKLSNDIKKITYMYDDLNSKNMEVLHKYADELKERARIIVDGVQNELNKFKAERMAKANTDIEEIQKKTDKLKMSIEDTFGDIEAYKRIVNFKSEEEVSKHYANKAFWEKCTYWAATGISVVIILTALGLAWTGMSSFYIDYVAIQDPKKLEMNKDTAGYAVIYLGFRLILSALLFLTVIYTSRIAYRSYIHWRHSESTMLKLSSLRPFINAFNDDEKKEIHKGLIQDYFGKDAGSLDGTDEKMKDVPRNITDIAIKAIERTKNESS